MFKKYFILVFIFASFVFLNNTASAFILDTGSSTPCVSKNVNATATGIISQNDLKGNIDVCLVPGSNPPFIINENSTTFATSTTVNSVSGTTTISMPYIFDISSIQKNEKISFDVFDGSGNNDSAEVHAYVPIVPITLSNNKGLTASSSILGAGQSITFTCTNSTELYYDPVVGQVNTPIVSDYTGATGYTLVYNVTPTPGDHTVECDNIDGSLTRKVFHFKGSDNKLDIDNTSYSPTYALSPVHFTWSSNGTNCSFYNYDKSQKYGNATSPSANNFSFDLNSPNFPQGANSYGYYIKCYDSNNPNILIDDLNSNLSSSTESINGVDTTVAWYHLVATFSCPNGYAPDTGNNNICIVQNNPSCSFTDPTDDFVSCTCLSGTLTSLSVDSTDGSSQVIVPPDTPFAWSNIHYRYRLNCGNLPALQRPYTHFLSFNVSAGYIKPGGLLDMNWIVQDPTTTCKIVGVDLKTGQEIFSSESSQYALVKNSITTSKTSSSSLKNFSDGSLKNLMNKALIINGSARFTASCDNNGAYMPGHYQLVRDVYTTTSQER